MPLVVVSAALATGHLQGGHSTGSSAHHAYQEQEFSQTTQAAVSMAASNCIFDP